MKRKITKSALIFLCIIVFAIIGNLGCLVKMGSSEDQQSPFQALFKINLIASSASLIEPLGPGSGGGRGPGPVLI